MTGPRVVRSPTLPVALRRCLGPGLDWLEARASRLDLTGTVLVGSPDPATWSRVAAEEDPLVVVPGFGPGPPTPLLEAAVRVAAVVVLLTGDRARIPAPTAARVVRAGLPAPSPAARLAGVCHERDAAARRAALLWRRVHHADPPAEGPAVRWLAGAGSAVAAAALCAAADGACPVALPGADPGPLPVLRARTGLDAVEVTRLLRDAGPLHDAVRAAAVRDAPPWIGPALAILEALVLAGRPAVLRP